MERTTPSLFFLPFFFVCFSFFLGHKASLTLAQNGAAAMDVGVVLDFGTSSGKKNWASISMAVDDFYATRGNVTRRVILHPRDSQGSIVGAASAAVDLLKNVKVQVIMGPSTSSQTEFVAIIGNKTHVPVVSFSATSPSLHTPYFVLATRNDSSLVGAISAIVKFHGWREVVPIYQDTAYGSGIIPFLIDAFNSINTRVPYRSVVPSNAPGEWFAAELHKLMSMQTRVFVVHMMPHLASRLFQHARAAGLMSAGFVWIATDGLTNVLNTLDPDVLDSMGGVLGVRSYVPKSSTLASFSARWRSRFARDNPEVNATVLPTVSQLWAYDAAWAIALVAEKAGTMSKLYDSPPRGSDNSTELGRLGVLRSGPKLLGAILSTQFRGVTGDFSLVDGQLQSSVFEIVNVMGKEGGRGVGFWSPAVKLVKDLRNVSDAGLKTVIWPGDSKEVAKGWEIPTMGKRLKIGVPLKNGFKEFLEAETDQVTGQVTVKGYCIDIFEAVMNALPYSVQFEYEPYDADSRDDLISQVYFQRLDAVVGDTTIIANRSLYIDFTLPYTESGVSMLVPVKEDKNKNAWIFLKPLTTDLWLASLAFFFFTGFIVWVIEHRINIEFRGPPSQQMGTIFYFAFSTMVFAHKERLESNLSRFAVIIWVFVVLILTSSYTASLTSMLTVQQLQLSVADIDELIKNGDYVGYQDGSFVKGLLKQLKFDETKLRNYSTAQEYADGLSRGSKNGGVSAIFDEIPYLKLFLSEHCKDFSMVGRTYKTGGFGFVFPRGSPLVPDISRAILNVTEGDMMAGFEKKWLGEQNSCPSDGSSFISSSLDFQSFGGLFLITGCVSLLALMVFLVTFLYKEWGELKDAASQDTLWRRMVRWAHHFDRKDLSSHTFKDTMNDGGSAQSNLVGDAVITPNIGDGSQSPISINLSDLQDEGSTSFREMAEQVIGEPPAEAIKEMAEIRDEH